MGTMIKAACENCRYEVKSSIGGGFMNHETVCDYPAVNTNTGLIETKNIYKRDKENRQEDNIMFYDNEKLLDKKSILSDETIMWDDYIIYDANYYCPVCKTFGLRFSVEGYFD